MNYFRSKYFKIKENHLAKNKRKKIQDQLCDPLDRFVLSDEGFVSPGIGDHPHTLHQYS